MDAIRLGEAFASVTRRQAKKTVSLRPLQHSRPLSRSILSNSHLPHTRRPLTARTLATSARPPQKPAASEEETASTIDSKAPSERQAATPSGSTRNSNPTESPSKESGSQNPERPASRSSGLGDGLSGGTRSILDGNYGTPKRQFDPRGAASRVKMDFLQKGSPTSPTSLLSFAQGLDNRDPHRDQRAMRVPVNLTGADRVAAQRGRTSASQMFFRNEYDSALSRALLKPPFRLNSSLGRSINIGAGRSTGAGEFELSHGFAMFGARCADMGLKLKSLKEATHERKGQRRKRLKVQRWEKLFNEKFAAVVDRVDVLRRQGW